MAGNKVTQPGDQLYPITLDRWYQGLVATTGPVYDKVQQLRTLKAVDPGVYRKAKTALPYVVCAVFHPAVRRKENFNYTACFMLDIDKLSGLSLSVEAVKRQLQSDNRIALMFVSPGNDGLKLLFLLKEKIYDAGIYSVFYKQFAAAFAAGHMLQGAVDLVTHDVSRCCFMSHDAQAWYNPQAQPVDAQEWLTADVTLFSPDAQVPDPEPVPIGEDPPATPTREAKNTALPQEVVDKIKERMGYAQKAKQANKDYFQPEALNEAMPALTAYLTEMQLQVAGVKPISYGKQLKIAVGHIWAEVNLFYGKAGFTTVKTTKTGSHAELAELAKGAIDTFFIEYMQLPLHA